MKRRTLVLLSMTLVLVGTVTVLAQQSGPQATNPTDTDYGTTGQHHNEGVYGAEPGLLSQHLAVARSQLMEARREVNPSARIDRVITALDELVLALEVIRGPVEPVSDHDAGHNEGHTASHTTHSGGCG